MPISFQIPKLGPEPYRGGGDDAKRPDTCVQFSLVGQRLQWPVLQSRHGHATYIVTGSPACAVDRNPPVHISSSERWSRSGLVHARLTRFVGDVVPEACVLTRAR